MLVDVGTVAISRAWKTHHLPSEHVYVAAVHRVAKHAFDGVLVQEVKKTSGLQLFQSLILCNCCERIESDHLPESGSIDFARRRFSLIPEVAWRILIEGALDVTIAVTAIGAGKLSVDI